MERKSHIFQLQLCLGGSLGHMKGQTKKTDYNGFGEYLVDNSFTFFIFFRLWHIHQVPVIPQFITCIHSIGVKHLDQFKILPSAQILGTFT